MGVFLLKTFGGQCGLAVGSIRMAPLRRFDLPVFTARLDTQGFRRRVQVATRAVRAGGSNAGCISRRHSGRS